MKLNNAFNHFCLFLGCVGLILLFRVIPHPPNFTPVIAMSFYLPLFFGFWSIPFIILAFAITDYFIGFHSLLIWTWSSLVIIGMLSKFSFGLKTRISLVITGSFMFFVVTNFGVWLTSSFYEQSLNGLLTCYIMGIPFYTNTLISTALFSGIIELIILSKLFFPNLFNSKLIK